MYKNLRLNRQSKGFTIVEIMVVIVILGIITALSVFSWGGWQVGIAEREVKSDLSAVIAAMKNDQNFNNAFSLDLPTNVKASSGVVLTYASGDSTTYCIDGVSKRSPQVRLFVTEAGGIKKGSCAEGEIADYGPFAGIGFRAVDGSPLGNHYCAISTTSDAYCWGINTYGQLGNNSTTTSLTPVAVSTSGVLSGKTIKSINVGTNHTCVIASDNNAYCWGQNGSSGYLGNNSTTNSSVPVAVSTSGALSGKTIKSINVGSNHTCVIASNDNAYCWGTNTYGQLGNNSTTTSLTPVAVSTSGALSGKTIKSISAGSYHTCAIASDNNAYCWGLGGSGRLGNNSTTDSSVPVAVSTSGALSGKTIISISAGHNQACAIASDNNAYCWGYNYYGGLGNNSTTNSSIPVAVTTSGALSGKTIKSISAGSYQACAVASDNNAYCWGQGSSGRLGNNSTAHSSVPVAVTTSGALSGKTIKSISAGLDNGCAAASDNNAYCWGQNSSGSLGDGTTTQSLVPVKVVNP